MYQDTDFSEKTGCDSAKTANVFCENVNECFNLRQQHNCRFSEKSVSRYIYYIKALWRVLLRMSMSVSICVSSTTVGFVWGLSCLRVPTHMIIIHTYSHLCIYMYTTTHTQHTRTHMHTQHTRTHIHTHTCASWMLTACNNATTR